MTRAGGYADDVGILSRIVTAIMTLVTAPFRALAALFGGRRRRAP